MVDDRFKNVLVFDIETTAPFGAPTSSQKLRVFGCYSYIDEKYHLLYNHSEIRKMIARHKYIVGFNSFGGKFHNDFFDGFDCQAMYFNGFSDIILKGSDLIYRFKGKVNIDLMMIIKKRAPAMKVKKGMLGDLLLRYSLDFITRTVGLVDESTAKLDFDYDLLKKEPQEWTIDEKALIESYTLRDLEITKKLYQWIEDYFKSFRDYMVQDDIDSKKYLSASTAVFTYKAICKAMGWREEYSDIKEKQSYGGGYVSFPSTEHAAGKIYCFDFSSLYPSIMTMCNIFSPTNDGWRGGDKFKVDGRYNDKTPGKVEHLIRSIYEQRLAYKKLKDPREYSLKIQMNAAYGLLGNPAFSHLYNRTSASDVTRLGRQFIKLARKRFLEAGYDVIYSDTDSTFLLDPFDNKEKLFEIKKQIVEEIQSSVPFPYPKQKKVVEGVEVEVGFDMGLDAEISDIWFFKGDAGDKETDIEMDESDHKNKPKKLIKKNYIYRKNDGVIVVKNLGVRKKSLSTLSRKIFWEILVPKITNERVVKFSEAYLKDTITELLQKDITLAQIRFSVKAADFYKMPSQLQAQISKRYGSGIHFLIPNLRGIGVGKDKNYCTMEEFEKNNMKITDINFVNVWAELSYFIKDSQMLISAFFA